MTTPSVSSLKGTGYRATQVPTMSPKQSELFNQLIGGASGGLGRGGLDFLSQLASGGSPEFWGQVEAPALRQFQQEAGGLGARFSNLGMGAQRSSAFKHGLGELSSDLSERLQSQRMNLQRQAIMDLLGLSENLLGQRSFETGLIPKKKSFWQELLGGLSGGAGRAFGSLPGLLAL